MIRGLLKFALLVVVVVALGAFFLGYRWADGEGVTLERPVGTTGETLKVDTAKAREAGAELGEKVAVGAETAQRAASAATLTSKIKAKMALDDGVAAANIDVDTTGTVVTLSGRVRSEAERARAVDLARETVGVTSVVDHLSISPR
jgi:hyperosmotically inducible protein